MNYYISNDELYHHGILGMKWGVRRYQNPDGSLTPAGQRHYGYKSAKKSNLNDFYKKVDAIESKHDADLEKAKSNMSKKEYNKYASKRWEEYLKDIHKVKNEYEEKRKSNEKEYGVDKKKRAVKIAAGIGAAVSVAATIKNAVFADAMIQGLTEGMGHVRMSEVLGKGALKAGQIAAEAALLTAGTIYIKDYIKDLKDNKN